MLKFYFFLITFIPIFFAQDSFSQSVLTEPFVIDQITISGNKSTHEWVIIRELTFEAGDSVTQEDIDFSMSRIEATYLFNRVEYFLRDFGPTGHKEMLILVTESIYFFPIPVLFFNGGRYDEYSIGGGVLHRNFRGYAEVIQAAAWFGFSPGFSLYYENPWVGLKSRHYFSANFEKINLTNRSRLYNQFTEKHFTIDLQVKKYFSRFFFGGLSLVVKQIGLDSPLNVNPDGEKEFWYMAPGFRLSWDSRDYSGYSHKGMMVDYVVQKNGVFSKNIDNTTLKLDHRAYFFIADRQAVAFQSLHFLTLGDVEVFQKNYFGYENRLRGYFYRQSESKNLMLNSIEYRFPITPITYFSIDGAPSQVGEAAQNIKIGLSGTLFVNHGINYDTVKEFQLRRLRSGLGFGLNLVVPYIDAIRSEFAWNDDGSFEGIFAIGMSF